MVRTRLEPVSDALATEPLSHTGSFVRILLINTTYVTCIFPPRCIVNVKKYISNV